MGLRDADGVFDGLGDVGVALNSERYAAREPRATLVCSLIEKCA